MSLSLSYNNIIFSVLSRQRRLHASYIASEHFAYNTSRHTHTHIADLNCVFLAEKSVYELQFTSANRIAAQLLIRCMYEATISSSRSRKFLAKILSIVCAKNRIQRLAINRVAARLNPTDGLRCWGHRSRCRRNVCQQWPYHSAFVLLRFSKGSAQCMQEETTTTTTTVELNLLLLVAFLWFCFSACSLAFSYSCDE